jgi:hypothetical protein
MSRRELQKTRWLALWLFADRPGDGWEEAWKTALLIRKISNGVLEGRELTEAEKFEIDVELGLAELPVADWVID